MVYYFITLAMNLYDILNNISYEILIIYRNIKRTSSKQHHVKKIRTAKVFHPIPLDDVSCFFSIVHLGFTSPDANSFLVIKLIFPSPNGSFAIGLILGLSTYDRLIIRMLDFLVGKVLISLYMGRMMD